MTTSHVIITHMVKIIIWTIWTLRTHMIRELWTRDMTHMIKEFRVKMVLVGEMLGK